MPNELERALHAGLLEQIQAALLVGAQEQLHATDCEDFERNVLQRLEFLFAEHHVGTLVSICSCEGEPDSLWRPGAVFGEVHVIIQEEPLQVLYFVPRGDDGEDHETR